jgi:hypothetical protein
VKPGGAPFASDWERTPFRVANRAASNALPSSSLRRVIRINLYSGKAFLKSEAPDKMSGASE